MTTDTVVDVMQSGVLTVLYVSAPPLIMGLVVGILVSLFQTVTSIQEATLAFVPKIVAVLLALVIFGNYMITTLLDCFIEMVGNIPFYM